MASRPAPSPLGVTSNASRAASPGSTLTSCIITKGFPRASRTPARATYQPSPTVALNRPPSSATASSASSGTRAPPFRTDTEKCSNPEAGRPLSRNSNSTTPVSVYISVTRTRSNAELLDTTVTFSGNSRSTYP